MLVLQWVTVEVKERKFRSLPLKSMLLMYWNTLMRHLQTMEDCLSFCLVIPWQVFVLIVSFIYLYLFIFIMSSWFGLLQTIDRISFVDLRNCILTIRLYVPGKIISESGIFWLPVCVIKMIMVNTRLTYRLKLSRHSMKIVSAFVWLLNDLSTAIEN